MSSGYFIDFRFSRKFLKSVKKVGIIEVVKCSYAGVSKWPEPNWSEKFEFGLDFDKWYNPIGLDFGQPDQIESWSDRTWPNSIRKSKKKFKLKQTQIFNSIRICSDQISCLELSWDYIFSNSIDPKCDWVYPNLIQTRITHP